MVLAWATQRAQPVHNGWGKPDSPFAIFVSLRFGADGTKRHSGGDRFKGCLGDSDADHASPITLEHSVQNREGQYYCEPDPAGDGVFKNRTASGATARVNRDHPAAGPA
jgi:hypothetical protein